MTQHSDTAPIVGIDLGTTNSLAAIVTPVGPRVLTDLTPSVVRYSSDQDPVVGDDALARIHEFPRRTVNSAKRLMGRSRADAGADLGYLGYKVVEGEHDTARIGLTLEDGSARVVSPQEVSADVLRAVASRASEALGEPVTRAVVTVPAYFDDAQRQATRDAGRLAGIDVVRIVNEPTAAALAYGIGTTKPTQPRTIAVFDLGGGTFDVSILSLVPSDQDNPTDFFRVLSTSGDTRLGGDDVDHALMDLFAREIEAQLRVTLDLKGDTLDPGVRRSLASFARGVKHELSDNDHADVRIDLGSDRVYERRVSREELDALIAPLLERAKLACERAIKDAKLSEHVDALVLVGGSTRIPSVRAAARDIFGVEPYTALDPDRVVAIGAAVQASIISGDTKGSLLLDVIPLSLGIETAGGAVAKLIMRNSTVPTRATERFSTKVDGQVNVKLNVVQGEREMVEDCRSLGVFELRGIPPMPAGVPKLVVEFVVDANGVLDVRAVEERSGKRAQIQIVPNHGLTEDEIRRIEEDSLTHAKDDMTRHRIADLITNASLDVKWISERLEKHGDSLDDDARAALESKLDEVRTHIRDASADHTSVDPNVFHAAKEALDQASIPLQEASIAASLRADQPR